jgi:hypothetical protein
MSRDTDSTPSVPSGRASVGRVISNAGWRGLERGKLSILHRRRDAPGSLPRVGTCPACGSLIRDRVAARLGFCDRCREFTGMCGAGRRIICPDMSTRTTWHTPCTELGAVAWEITVSQRPCRTLLCSGHDAQVRSGGTPWIAEAMAVDPASSGYLWQSVGMQAAVNHRAR